MFVSKQLTFVFVQARTIGQNKVAMRLADNWYCIINCYHLYLYRQLLIFVFVFCFMFVKAREGRGERQKR